MIRPLFLAALLLTPSTDLVGRGRDAAVEPRDDPPVEAPTERELIARHVRTVRSSKLALTEKLDALEALLELGTEGPRQAAGELDRLLDKAGKSYSKDRARALREVGKRAKKLLDARLDRKALSEIDETRRRLLSHSRSRSLTKDEVVEHCDPALERLRELQRLEQPELESAHPELAEALADLAARASDGALMADYFLRAKTALAEGDRSAQRAAERLELPWDPRGEDALLAADLAHALWIASPMSEADRRVLARNVELRAEVPGDEAEGNRLLNEIRLLAGLNAVLTDPKLCAAGRDHSKDMDELGFFSHDSPVEGKESFGQRASNFGTSAHAENIAAGQRSPRGAIDAWWYSPGHHRNMMGGHARVGLGRHGNHWTQLFGG